MSTPGVLRAVSHNGHARLNKPIGTGTWKRTQKNKQADRQTDNRSKINILKLCNHLQIHMRSDNWYPFSKPYLLCCIFADETLVYDM